jgi:anti-sigma factor RsiW
LRRQLDLVLETCEREEALAYQRDRDALDLAIRRRRERQAAVRGWISIASKAIGTVAFGAAVAAGVGVAGGASSSEVVLKWLGLG